MIFPYDPPDAASFWMKNTLIPLDIVFIRVDRRFQYRRKREAAVARLDSVAAGMSAAVLELRGGRAAELGITKGDRVSWEPSGPRCARRSWRLHSPCTVGRGRGAAHGFLVQNIHLVERRDLGTACSRACMATKSAAMMPATSITSDRKSRAPLGDLQRQ